MKRVLIVEPNYPESGFATKLAAAVLEMAIDANDDSLLSDLHRYPKGNLPNPPDLIIIDRRTGWIWLTRSREIKNLAPNIPMWFIGKKDMTEGQAEKLTEYPSINEDDLTGFVADTEVELVNMVAKELRRLIIPN